MSFNIENRNGELYIDDNRLLIPRDAQFDPVSLIFGLDTSGVPIPIKVGSDGSLSVSGISIDISGGDINIGTVELKDGVSSVKASIDLDNTQNALYVQSESLATAANQATLISQVSDIQSKLAAINSDVSSLEALLTHNPSSEITSWDLTGGYLDYTTWTPGYNKVFKAVLLHSLVPLNETVTVKLDSSDGTNFDTVLDSKILSNATDYTYYSGIADWVLKGGDEINIQCTNLDVTSSVQVFVSIRYDLI